MTDDIKAYASEFFGTAILMIAGISRDQSKFGENSQVGSLIPNQMLRLAFAGAGFGLGAVVVVYSILGQTSGGISTQR